MKREHQINFCYVIVATLAVIWIQQPLFQPTRIKSIPQPAQADP